MNLVLLFEEDFIAPDRVHLGGRRFEHIRDVLKLKASDLLTVGKLNGFMGQGRILQMASDHLQVEVRLDQQPPKALDLTLIMALVRPPMLRRSLQCASMLGVKKIIILNFSKVDKSLWQSSALKPEAIRQELVLGLEQAKDTILPDVILKKQFKPFVEDELALLVKDADAFVAHPGESAVLPVIGPRKMLLIIGPEGGITEFEMGLIREAGVKAVGLGERILRFEHVIPYVLGKVSV